MLGFFLRSFSERRSILSKQKSYGIKQRCIKYFRRHEHSPAFYVIFHMIFDLQNAKKYFNTNMYIKFVPTSYFLKAIYIEICQYRFVPRIFGDTKFVTHTHTHTSIDFLVDKFVTTEIRCFPQFFIVRCYIRY